MSNETLSTTAESAVKDELNPSNSIHNNEVTESTTGTNGSYYSNGNNDQMRQEEQQNQENEQDQQSHQEYPNDDVESTKNNYNDQEQPMYNKNDLEPEALRKVFIGGLSYKTEDDAFKEYFSKYGDIVDCIIMRDREGRSRGFGFVTYAAAVMVDRLMAARPHVLDAREIEPKRAVPREESGKPEASLSAKKLFVGGIREGTINEHDLNEYFSKYGNIIDAVIMKTNEGKFRGFGFVEFDDYDPVDKIVLEKHHVIKGNPVNVEKALPKDQTNRARMAAANYGGGPGGGRGGGGGMRGPPPSSRAGGGGGGGWGPMGGESNFGGGGGGGGYRSGGGGGYGSGDDYGNRGGPYGGGGGGYGGDMRSGGGGNNMMGFGGSAPMGGNGGPGGYGIGGPPPPPPASGGYDDPFGAFGPPPGYGFGQNYGTSSGGGPMRRGGGGGGGGRGHANGPYSRGGGRGGGGGGGYRGRN